DVSKFERVWARRVTIPVALEGLMVDLDSGAREHVRDLVVRAVSIVPESERAAGDREAGHGVRYGNGALFALRGELWVENEGIWVAARNEAAFVVRSDEAGVSHLFLRNGATANEVTLSTGPWRQNVTLAPGEERVVDIPLGQGRTAAQLDV